MAEIRAYISDFEKLGYGLFVHFGLYSVLGKGEWAKLLLNISDAQYEALAERFSVKEQWAQNLVKTAKAAGCKYITVTTRHHDGFSLYDTKGLNNYDAPHSKCGRDLIKEFVFACRDNGVTPFFYHTLLDWRHRDYNENFPRYIDYLIKSIEVLCTSYGKIGGFWLDGTWNKPQADWQEDRLYATIRKHQPQAMIINNTGISREGEVGHPEIDSVTFERGKPAFADNFDRHRAGEMCQVLNDHWGYAKNDCNYKSVKTLIENLVDCRLNNCNFLLNTGLLGNGSVNPADKSILGEVGKWVKVNKGFIYSVKSAEIKCQNAALLKDGEYYYAVIFNVPMSSNPDSTFTAAEDIVKIPLKGVKQILWLDDKSAVKYVSNQSGVEFRPRPFPYGTSLAVRVARIKTK